MIPPLAIPCRVCLAAPGTACSFLPSTDGLEIHPTRESDAALTLEYLGKLGEEAAAEARRRAASPSVVVRSKDG